ncbi:potassium channel family protein [Halobacillus sp. B23F22_1]|uniref:potassium channel family protein n=1 Tax=Halobacillus sp. B23F22_1 TaxID=3459514 RepID=UPI00373EBA93
MTIKKTKKTALFIAYEGFLITLALLSVLFIWSENTTLSYIDNFIWIIFLIDVLVRLIKARNKWRFIKHNPFDFVAALPLDSIFQLARFARLIKIIRVSAISKQNLKPFFKILRTNGLDRVFTLSFLLIFGAAVIIKIVEPEIESFSDGVWWSIVTATTVGYGDISPDTMVGRLIAVILMLIGIGLIGMLTGAITTFFVKEQKSQHPTVSFIRHQLSRYEDLTLDEMKQLAVLMEEMKEEKREVEKH